MLILEPSKLRTNVFLRKKVEIVGIGKRELTSLALHEVAEDARNAG